MVSYSGPSRLPWGRDIGSTHGVWGGVVQTGKLRSLSSWIALSRLKALSLVSFALGT